MGTFFLKGILSSASDRLGTLSCLQVNHKEVAGWHQVLEQCDRVEVFESAWAEADPLRLGLASDRDLEHSRQLLQRMFSRSGSLPADIAALGFQAGQPITN